MNSSIIANMKAAILMAGLFFSGALAAQNTVVAQVSNFENNKGICRACIFSSAENFAANRALACVQGTVANKSAAITFSNVPDGRYAIFVFHDVNGNNKMDRNFLGIPKEGYGASANKLPFAAAPRFTDNSFALSGGAAVTLHIKLRNL